MTPDRQEIINTMALTRARYLNLTSLHDLYTTAGTATTVMEQARDIRAILPEASDRLVKAFQQAGEWRHWAEMEYEICTERGYKVLTPSDDRFPLRLKNCPDAPLVLYYKGSANLNQSKIICMVGTRRSTLYGNELAERFVKDLRLICPQVLIVSGLAYGIDICAHRAALQNGYETLGVLAHGLDNLYPSMHRYTADEMVKNGGLLTEFPTHTNADKLNFVRRNRIVAGLSDACIVVESAAHGGALITASLARSYNRDVFAFPGNVGAEYSAGCNNLVRDNMAGLITSASDFAKAMGWANDMVLAEAQRKGIERELFPELSDEEQKLVNLLRDRGDLQINVLTVMSNMPVNKVNALLFQLEMKGVVKSLAGGNYHLLN